MSFTKFTQNLTTAVFIGLYVTGLEAVVKLLLDNGAKLGTKDEYGRTPLSYSVRFKHEAVVKLLRENSTKRNLNNLT